MFETPFTVQPFDVVIAILNVFDVIGFESVVVEEQFIKRPAVNKELPAGPVAPIVPPPPPPVIGTFVTLVMRPHLSTVICGTSFASPYVPGRTDPPQQSPFAMESVIYYRTKKMCDKPDTPSTCNSHSK
jgi:hypothetical protein